MSERWRPTGEHHEVATLLGAFGPWSAQQLAETLRMPASRAGRLAAQIAARGWAVRHSGGRWALTASGYGMLDAWEADVLLAPKRDEPDA